MKPQRAFVTGGAGFVGSALVRELLAGGWEVVAYDRLAPGKIEFLPAHPALRLVVGDILDQPTLADSIADAIPDVVFHLAAIHYIPYCKAHPAETLRVNVEGTQAVLDACRRVEVPKLLFCSTAAVYPPEAEALGEDLAPGPLDVYGYSKLFGESLVDLYHRQTGAACLIARLFNVYGPRETSPHLIPEIVDQLLAGARELQLGNLTSKRDYVHVEDVARALGGLARLPIAPQASPLRVNVGTGKERSAREIVELLGEIGGTTTAITQDPARVRPSDRPHLRADVSRLRELLGWAPDTDLRAGLRDLLQWTQQQSPERLLM
jgi:UDP-glucose 4-epimerase